LQNPQAIKLEVACVGVEVEEVVDVEVEAEEGVDVRAVSFGVGRIWSWCSFFTHTLIKNETLFGLVILMIITSLPKPKPQSTCIFFSFALGPTWVS